MCGVGGIAYYVILYASIPYEIQNQKITDMNIEKYVSDLSEFIRYKFGETGTEKTYCGNVKLFLYKHQHIAQPKAITAKMIIDYLLAIPNLSTRYSAHSAIKFFYNFIQPHGESKKFKYIPYPEKVEYLPNAVTKEEFIALMQVCKNIKHQCIMMLAFDCGLRVSEIVNLKIANIRSDIMQVQVRQTKGRKDRYVKLTGILLSFLRNYFLEYKPLEYLFYGQYGKRTRYSVRSCQELLETYRIKANIPRHIKFHEQRHGYAMSLLENGTDLSKIQRNLGHNSPKTTEIYARMNNKVIQQTESPLEQIVREKDLLGINQQHLLTA
jgi:site-specific recombinase XerD